MCDLYDLGGKFSSYEKILEMSIKTYFIEYFGIKKTMTSRKKHSPVFFIKLYGPHIPNSLKIFIKYEKRMQDMYRLLVCNSKQVITAVKKWQANGNIFFLEKILNNVFLFNYFLKFHRIQNAGGFYSKHSIKLF